MARGREDGIFSFAGHASIMKNLLRKDLMEGISCRETSEPMRGILKTLDSVQH
jgi:hypothetical protein